MLLIFIRENNVRVQWFFEIFYWPGTPWLAWSAKSPTEFDAPRDVVSKRPHPVPIQLTEAFLPWYTFQNNAGAFVCKEESCMISEILIALADFLWGPL